MYFISLFIIKPHPFGPRVESAEIQDKYTPIKTQGKGKSGEEVRYHFIMDNHSEDPRQSFAPGCDRGIHSWGCGVGTGGGTERAVFSPR